MAEFITLAEIKQQSYLSDADTSEDRFLEHLRDVALAHIENYTNRKLYLTGTMPDPTTHPDEAEVALEFKPNIKHAALLLIGHWYENRENMVVGTTVNNIKIGFESLVGPYKYIPV